MSDTKETGSIFAALRKAKRENTDAIGHLHDMIESFEVDSREDVQSVHAAVDRVLHILIDEREADRKSDKWSRKLAFSLTALFVTANVAVGVDLWQGYKNRQIMNAVIAGDSVVSASEDWYAVSEKDPQKNNPCHEFRVNMVTMSYLNRRPAGIDPTPLATFRIPVGCEP